MENIENIKGIGPKTIELLHKINIKTTNDLLTYYPFRYEILEKTSFISEKAIVEGIIEIAPKLFYFSKQRSKMSLVVRIENKIINVVIYNRAFLKNNLVVGRKITIIGKYDSKKNVLTASDILLMEIPKTPSITPIYHLVNGLKQNVLRRLIANNLKQECQSNLPIIFEEKYNFMNYKDALTKIHFPTKMEEIKEASNRLIYEELFEFMFKMNYIKQAKKRECGIKRSVNLNQVEEFISELSFELTKDQYDAVIKILDDLNSENSMNRLLQGDVGSGKTIVAIISMYINYLSGHMSALMVPTEVLARQHYENVLNLFKKYDIKVELLTGKLKKSEKEKIKKQINNKEIDVIIGTHSLITEDLNYQNLGLVITDEQHRFGVNQRSAFKSKGENPDILYMSATPIPRTYALTIYGDMEISSIKTMPSGRKEIKTIIKNDSDIKNVLELMLEELKKNHQIYVIAPLIEDTEDSEMESVDLIYENMNKAFGKYFKVGKMHGKLKNTEKEDIMNKFKENEINILVSTTVIEVGVDVKNATMIVIYDAYRFGLSTLHQLRGRVGRNSLESKCILISSKETERLKILESTNDGFKVAEEDFILRGSGDLFGNRQSGDMLFKIANIKKDFNILVKAKDDSERYLSDNNYNSYYNEIINNLKELS